MTAPAVTTPPLSAVCVVNDDAQRSTIRMTAMGMGRAHGLDADATERLGTVAAEMAGNIARHAGTGQIIVRAVGDHGTGRIEILALDKGPGIANMTRVMRDGGSTSGEYARDGGLAGVRRQADLFDIYSHKGRGTAVVAQIGASSDGGPVHPSAEAGTHDCVGAVCVPVHGEAECGDSWAIQYAPGRVTVMLVDGLGHGPEAAAAALAALSVFREAAGDTPEFLLGAMHRALHRTRGAALSVTVLDQLTRTASFCGVGNVDGRVVTAESNRHLVPQNGIVGHTMPRAQAASVPWPADGRLVMHSDGIASRWQPDQYPGLLARHPSLLAGVLFRDFARERDDATVLVLPGSLPQPSA